MKANRDEALEEIWAIRRQIAKKFDYDPKKQVAHYQRKQKQLGLKIYRPEVSPMASLHAVDALHDGPCVETASQPIIRTSYRASRSSKSKRGK